MKKYFWNLETIRFAIYAISLFALGLWYVYRADATMQDLNKRILYQENKTTKIECQNEENSKKIAVSETKIDMVYELVTRMDTKLDKLLVKGM